MIEQTQRERLQKRWNSLKNERSSWLSHWKEISTFMLPRSGRFLSSDRNKGERRHNSIYDSSGTRAHRILAAGMMAGMTSPARPWFRFGASDPELMKYGPVKIWLNDATRIALDIFAKSNTYRAFHTIYGELGAFGTAADIVVDDFHSVIHHHPLTVGEYCLATNWKGEIVTLYREFEKTVSEVITEFGYRNCGSNVQNMFDRGDLDKWIPVIHTIEPRSDRERDPAKRDAKNMAWKSCYFESSGSPDKFLRESGFNRFPALCPRWDAIGGDIYGSNAPGMEALGDVKQLQHEQLRKAEGIDYKTKPPLQVPTTLKDRHVDRLPGGIIYYDPVSPNGGVKSAFEVNLDLNHLLADIQDVRQRINSAFYADMFLMLASADDTQKTATEIAERHEEKMMMIGPVVERLHNELLNPHVDMTFEKMLRAGMLPPPPDELQGQEINVEFISVLAQAQRAIGTNSIDRFVMNLGVVAQAKPDVLDKFDGDKWVDVYSDSLGVDPSLIVADDKVALIRKQRAQDQQTAQQAALANSAADTAQKLGSVPTNQSNAATQVMNMFSGYN